jgi:hypothetical protein
MSPNNTSTTKAIQPFIILAVMAAATFYLVNVFNTGDWLWFKSETVDARPSRIIIRDHGQETLYAPGYAGYEELAGAVEQSLARLDNSALVDVGLSEVTLAEYETNAVVMELYFDRPVDFHTQARIGEPTQMLIPLEGRHAGNGYIFLGARGEWWVGALRMADDSPLYTTLTQMGYTALRQTPVGSN